MLRIGTTRKTKNAPGDPGRVLLDASSLAQVCLRPFELEGHVELGAIGLDLALGVELHVELDDFRDAEIAQRLRGALDRDGRGLLPGSLAGADQFDDLVDAVRHDVLPFGFVAGRMLLPVANLAWKAGE